jgi:hypothetical protein
VINRNRDREVESESEREREQAWQVHNIVLDSSV